MVLQNHRPLRREIFTDEVVLPALSHRTPTSHNAPLPLAPKGTRGSGHFLFCNPIPFRLK